MVQEWVEEENWDIQRKGVKEIIVRKVHHWWRLLVRMHTYDVASIHNRLTPNRTKNMSRLVDFVCLGWVTYVLTGTSWAQLWELYRQSCV